MSRRRSIRHDRRSVRSPARRPATRRRRLEGFPRSSRGDRRRHGPASSRVGGRRRRAGRGVGWCRGDSRPRRGRGGTPRRADREALAGAGRAWRSRSARRRRHSTDRGRVRTFREPRISCGSCGALERLGPPSLPAVPGVDREAHRLSLRRIPGIARATNLELPGVPCFGGGPDFGDWRREILEQLPPGPTSLPPGPGRMPFGVRALATVLPLPDRDRSAEVAPGRAAPEVADDLPGTGEAESPAPALAVRTVDCSSAGHVVDREVQPAPARRGADHLRARRAAELGPGEPPGGVASLHFRPVRPTNRGVRVLTCVRREAQGRRDRG